MDMKKVIEDNLGIYEVIVESNNKPTTIKYAVICDTCGNLNSIIGSPTTRKKTLTGSKIPCFYCMPNIIKQPMKILGNGENGENE